MSWVISRGNKRLLIGVIAALALGGCAQRVVTRSSSGTSYEGRYIPARAYEAYARGVVAEQDGALKDALAAFEEAAELDPDGAEPLVSAAGILCATNKPTDIKRAEGLLDHAVQLSPSLARAHFERARCARAARTFEAARAHAELALVFAPSDEATLLLLVEIYDAIKEPSLAEGLLVSHCLTDHPSRPVAARLLDRGRAKADMGLIELAERAFERARATSSQRPQKETLARVDQALFARDLPLARKRALRAGLSQGELAIRAFALNLVELAKTQATLVAEASPSDVPSRVALLLTTGRDTSVAPSMRLVPDPGEARLSPLGELLLYEWLRVRLGGDVVGPRPTIAEPAHSDPVFLAVEKRVHAGG